MHAAVHLDRRDTARGPNQRLCQHARPGPDLDDVVVPREPGGFDRHVDDLGVY